MLMALLERGSQPTALLCNSNPSFCAGNLPWGFVLAIITRRPPKVAAGGPLAALRSRQEFHHLVHKCFDSHRVPSLFAEHWLLRNSSEKEISLTGSLLVSSDVAFSTEVHYVLHYLNVTATVSGFCSEWLSVNCAVSDYMNYTEFICNCLMFDKWIIQLDPFWFSLKQTFFFCVQIFQMWRAQQSLFHK